MATRVDPDVVANAKKEEWYFNEPPQVSSTAREIFENWSGVPSDQVVAHVTQLRERAFEVFPYPCIGRYRFLEPHIGRLPFYPTILERIKLGEKFLDVGCCFGQEVRKLAHDGAPVENLYGSDLQGEFLKLGYELFLDEHKLKSSFIQANIFEPATQLDSLDGQLSFILAQSFFHLFQWDEQITVAKRLIKLLDATKPCLMFGGHMGHKTAGPFVHPSGIGSYYQHSAESWRKLWFDVGTATGTSWEVQIQEMDMSKTVGGSNTLKNDEEGFYMVFVLRRK